MNEYEADEGSSSCILETDKRSNSYFKNKCKSNYLQVSLEFGTGAHWILETTRSDTFQT